MDLVSGVMQELKRSQGEGRIKDFVYAKVDGYVREEYSSRRLSAPNAKGRRQLVQDCAVSYLNGYAAAASGDYDEDQFEMDGWEHVPGLDEGFIASDDAPDFAKSRAVRYAKSVHAAMSAQGEEKGFEERRLGRSVPRWFVAGFMDGVSFHDEYNGSDEERADAGNDLMSIDDMEALASMISDKAADAVIEYAMDAVAEPGRLVLLLPDHPFNGKARQMLSYDIASFVERALLAPIACFKKGDEELEGFLEYHAGTYARGYMGAIIEIASNAIGEDEVRKAATMRIPRSRRSPFYDTEMSYLSRSFNRTGERTSAGLACLRLDTISEGAPRELAPGHPFYYTVGAGYIDGVYRYGEYMSLSMTDAATAASFLELMSSFNSGIGDDEEITDGGGYEAPDGVKDAEAEEHGVPADEGGPAHDASEVESDAASSHHQPRSFDRDRLIMTFAACLGRSDEARSVISALAEVNARALGYGVGEPATQQEIERFGAWFSSVYGERDDVRKEIEYEWDGELPAVLERSGAWKR